jgi:hypothetical protein
VCHKCSVTSYRASVILSHDMSVTDAVGQSNVKFSAYLLRYFYSEGIVNRGAIKRILLPRLITVGLVVNIISFVEMLSSSM